MRRTALGIAAWLLILAGPACRETACGQGSALEVTATNEDKPLPPVRVAKLSLGLTPYLGSAATLERAGPLIDYLSRSVGVPVVGRAADSYAQLVDDVTSGRVDIAALSPLSYVMARSHGSPLRIIATPVERGSPTYLGYIVVRADDRRYRHVSDLRGARFAYVERTSASGYLYPRALMRRYGLDPDRALGSTLMVGSHPEVTRAIIEGRADAGAVASSLFDPPSNMLGLTDRLRVIGKTARIPFDAYCVRRDLDEGAVLRVQRALFAVSHSYSLQQQVATPVGYSGWIEGDDSRYDSIRRVLSETGARSPALP